MKLTGENRQLGEKPVPVPLCPPQISHGLDLGSNPGLRGERPATSRLSHGKASFLRVTQCFVHEPQERSLKEREWVNGKVNNSVLFYPVTVKLIIVCHQYVTVWLLLVS
jgi:hypothetical protein